MGTKITKIADSANIVLNNCAFELDEATKYLVFVFILTNTPKCLAYFKVTLPTSEIREIYDIS